MVKIKRKGLTAYEISGRDIEQKPFVWKLVLLMHIAMVIAWSYFKIAF